MTGVEHSNRETAGVAGHVMLPGKDGAACGFFWHLGKIQNIIQKIKEWCRKLVWFKFGVG